MRRMITALAVLSFLPVLALAQGAAIYAAKCASCHGKEGKGNPAMAKMFKVEPSALNLADSATQALKDGDLKATISKGKGKMPAFAGKLKDEESRALIVYFRSLKK